MKVLVTATSFKAEDNSPALQYSLDRLKTFADEIVFNPYGRPLVEDELAVLLPGCAGYIAGLDFVTKKALEAACTLRVISRYGVGYERVDIAAAHEKGIVVCNTPGANSQAVADLTFALILAVARKVPALDRDTKAGKWTRSIGIELYGKTIGILGLGAVGKAVARRAQGFSMKVLAYDPFINADYAQGIIITGFDTVIQEADIICLHMPLTGETWGIISGNVMKRMKKGAILINTARGGLLDEAAACELLKAGHLGGLGLDTYEEEPPHASPLFELDNVVLTPHSASHTAEATANMASMAVDNLITVLSGQPCSYIVGSN
ncbi:MAG: phosphoglycerate dehydrogenase [Treponema sp.]|jgi:D-3-phosphoglycerate dehydrogenase|nr:phosphoglycerate dehydrogenase [Treponema sp.]